MSDDAKQKTDDAVDGGDAQTSDAGAGSDTGAQATAGGADAGKTFTQADVDRIAQERAAREKRNADKKLAELQAKIDEHEAEAERKRQEALTEEQRKEEARLAAEKRAAELETQLATERTARLRSELIAAEAAHLPAAYKARVTGEGEDEIKASIAKAVEDYQQDNAGKLDASGLRQAMALAPEARLERYGPELGAALNEMAKTPAQSVGSPSNAQGQPPAGAGKDATQKLDEVMKLPPGPQRDNAWLAAMAGKT